MIVNFTMIVPGYIQGGRADLTVSIGLVCQRKGELKAGKKGGNKPRALAMMTEAEGTRKKLTKDWSLCNCARRQAGALRMRPGG